VNYRRGGHNRALGLEFTHVSAVAVEARLPVGELHKQAYGVVHGGVYASIAESICSVGAGVNVIPLGRAVVGLDNHTSFLRAVREGTLHARAVPVHRGSRSQVWSAEMWDDAGRVVARSRVTLMVLEPGANLAGAKVAMRTPIKDEAAPWE
ncbi:MAG: PaaI family thioesterase, partial [Myxococcota bacterium]